MQGLDFSVIALSSFLCRTDQGRTKPLSACHAGGWSVTGVALAKNAMFRVIRLADSFAVAGPTGANNLS
jgi:hypothetical protein